jgi:PAS domain S-box-containing protein
MARPLSVLLVADANDAIVPRVLEELARADYDIKFEQIDTPAALRAALAQPRWEVILCEYNLLHFSAPAALAILKDTGFDVPFLVLLDAAEPHEQRAAWSIGGNDVIRHYNLVRLVPAIERELTAAKIRAARALTEAALRESDAKYQKLVEQIPVGVHTMALDTLSSTLSISPQLERMLGYSQAEWVADPDLWRNQIHEEDREAVLRGLSHIYAPGAGPFIAEYRLLTREGHERWIRDETILVRDPAGQPQYLQSMKMDITERKQVETTAETVDASLNQWVKELEQSHREISLLNEMSTQLQGCLTLEEVYPVMADFGQLLFPAEDGAFYLFNGTQMEPVSRWGHRPPEEVIFGLSDCWALRRGRIYAAEVPFSGPVCPHVIDSISNSYMCVPLVAQGETLGLLHVRLRRNTGLLNPEGPRDTLTETKQRLASIVAERMALALANLKLQAQLRAKVETAESTNGNGQTSAGADATGEGGEAAAPKRLMVGALTLNTDTFELMVGDRTVMPTPTEFQLLQFLMSNPGKVYTAEQLLQDVWKYPPGTGSQEVVRAHIRNLRNKMEPNPRQPIYLRTIGRFGYTITAEETQAQDAAGK